MIHPTVIIEEGAKIHESVIIGPYCLIGSNVSIEEDVIIGGFVLIASKNIPRKENTKPVIIKRGARILAGSLIVAGTVIGENAMVGYASLVDKNIPERELWFGSPAKRVRIVPEDEWV